MVFMLWNMPKWSIITRPWKTFLESPEMSPRIFFLYVFEIFPSIIGVVARIVQNAI